ncbi:MAG: DUF5916 domain-containing protein [Ferruginibacter sp.]
MKQLIVLLLLFSCARSFAQQRDGETFQRDYRYEIEKTAEHIKIDGELNEAVWSTAAKTGDFWLKFPNDIGRPKNKTEVRVTYDDKFIYFGFTAQDSGKAFIQSLKRDNGHDGNDCVAIVLDPTNQRTNGFFFVVNAFNAQSEDQLPLPEENAWSWDNKWYSATKRYPDKWTAEIAIPFKTIRYTADKLLWGINFLRVDPVQNEYSVWTHLPVNFASHTLVYTGALVWKTPPPPAGGNNAFIPYINGELNKDNQNGLPIKSKANAGFDAKVALTSSLNLDITANPDFSQVEVDRQVTNLSRFSIFFPERRTFFLENSDLFSNYGYPDARPFYSRTIGLDANGNRIPIIGGVRLTGNIDKSTRIGVMNMQTAKKDDVAAQNYTAATIQRRVLKRSVVKAYFLNHENFISSSEKQANPLSAYGRNAGAEFEYNDLEGKWGGWAAYNHSFKKNVTDHNAFFQAGGQYNTRNFTALVNYAGVGTNYYTDMGYVLRIENYDALRDTVVRLGYRDLWTEASYRIYPEKGNVIQHTFFAYNDVIFNPDNSVNERSQMLEYSINFRNTSNAYINVIHNDVNLLFPTSFTDKTPLPKGNYSYYRLRAGYNTDFRKVFSININGGIGSFYNGNYKSLSTTITVRKQPHLNLGLTTEYNRLDFPDPHGSTELFLIAPRVELNFSTSIFWTTFFQYNTQRNNVNINSRLQWRFKPMSDIFVVYTDNYFTDPFFKNKNRALVFKMNYWLNW